MSTFGLCLTLTCVKLLQSHYGIGIKLSQNFGEQISQLEDYLVEQLVHTPALGGLPQKVIGPMARSMQPHQLRRGSFLYQSGEQAEALYLLERGAPGIAACPYAGGAKPNRNAD